MDDEIENNSLKRKIDDEEESSSNKKMCIDAKSSDTESLIKENPEKNLSKDNSKSRYEISSSDKTDNSQTIPPIKIKLVSHSPMPHEEKLDKNIESDSLETQQSPSNLLKNENSSLHSKGSSDSVKPSELPIVKSDQNISIVSIKDIPDSNPVEVSHSEDVNLSSDENKETENQSDSSMLFNVKSSGKLVETEKQSDSPMLHNVKSSEMCEDTEKQSRSLNVISLEKCEEQSDSIILTEKEHEQPESMKLIMEPDNSSEPSLSSSSECKANKEPAVLVTDKNYKLIIEPDTNNKSPADVQVISKEDSSSEDADISQIKPESNQESSTDKGKLKSKESTVVKNNISFCSFDESAKNASTEQTTGIKHNGNENIAASKETGSDLKLNTSPISSDNKFELEVQEKLGVCNKMSNDAFTSVVEQATIELSEPVQQDFKSEKSKNSLADIVIENDSENLDEKDKTECENKKAVEIPATNIKKILLEKNELSKEDKIKNEEAIKQLQDIDSLKDSNKPSILSKEDSNKTSTLSKEDSNNTCTLSNEYCNKPSELSKEDCNKPSTLSKEDCNKPSALSADDSNKSCTLSNEDCNKPSELSKEDCNKPSKLSKEDCNKPSTLSKEDRNKPSALSAVDSNKPSMLSADDSNIPSTLSKDCNKPSTLLKDCNKPSTLSDDSNKPSTLLADNSNKHSTLSTDNAKLSKSSDSQELNSEQSSINTAITSEKYNVPAAKVKNVPSVKTNEELKNITEQSSINAAITSEKDNAKNVPTAKTNEELKNITEQSSINAAITLEKDNVKYVPAAKANEKLKNIKDESMEIDEAIMPTNVATQETSNMNKGQSNLNQKIFQTEGSISKLPSVLKKGEFEVEKWLRNKLNEVSSKGESLSEDKINELSNKSDSLDLFGSQGAGEGDSLSGTFFDSSENSPALSTPFESCQASAASSPKPFDSSLQEDNSSVSELKTGVSPRKRKRRRRPLPRKRPSKPVVIDEETRMDANSITGNLLHPGSLLQDEDSQSSTGTNSKKKHGRCEVVVPESTEAFTVDKVIEYFWPLEGLSEHYFIQEHISEYLGIMSFKRRYPDLRRRPIDGQEKEYLKDKGAVTERACDLGLTAVRSEDVMDVMFNDFPSKYEELMKALSDRKEKQLKEDGKVDYQVVNLDKSKMQEYSKKAAEDAARWNLQFNKDRREERKYSVDLQSYTMHYQTSRMKKLPPEATKIGSFPLAVLPGQYTDYYRNYSPLELKMLPLQSVMLGPFTAEELNKNIKQESENENMSTAALTPENKDMVDSSTQNDTITVEKQPQCKECNLGRDKNKAGKPEVLVVCASCHSANHPSCISLTIPNIAKVESYAWQCMDCKRCAQCNDPDEEDKMIFCDMCDRGYHIFCCGLRKVPNGRWHCKECNYCSSCGARSPAGFETNIKNADWQHEFKTTRDKKERRYICTLCVPCDKYWKRRQYCHICLKVYKSIPESGMVRCMGCPKYTHKDVCSDIHENERFCNNCIKSRRKKTLDHKRIIAAAKRKMASGF